MEPGLHGAQPGVRIPRKLIEVALPLDAINAAARAEKHPFTRRHPRSLHTWWARRPQGTARAILFAQMVNDPSWRWEVEHAGETPSPALVACWSQQRARLLALVGELARWENSAHAAVLERARREIRISWQETCEINREHPQAALLFEPGRLPGFHDPFAGGGSIPLEAQRLGLDVTAGDLNPVAVLINRALVEIPHRLAHCAPANPEARAGAWPGASGLADDVRHYGRWMLQEASRRLADLYPQVEITPLVAQGRPDLQALVGRHLPVVAWLWARTVPSPSPAYRHVAVPLVSSFVLSTRSGSGAWIQPEVEGERICFTVRRGIPPPEAAAGTKTGRGASFRCLLSGVAIAPSHVKSQGRAGNLGAVLMAVVAQGPRGRIYLPPIAGGAVEGVPGPRSSQSDRLLPDDPRNFWTPAYGLERHADLFTRRQWTALATFCDLVDEARGRVHEDALASGGGGDPRGLEEGGSGAVARAQAVATYLGLAVSRWADLHNTLCTWNATNQNIRSLFARQAIPMAWDFAELNALGRLAGFDSVVEAQHDLLCALPAHPRGRAFQQAAQESAQSVHRVVSSDPPYFDNISYADLSEFFHPWLERCLGKIHAGLLGGGGAPKAEELVAEPHRHGGREGAARFFREGMARALRQVALQAHPAVPLTFYYACGPSSRGWQTFLEALCGAGLEVTAAWPVGTERRERSTSRLGRTLSSSLVLVCRRRAMEAPSISRSAFERELERVLSAALAGLTQDATMRDVDVAQALVGPAVALYSRHSAVLDGTDSPLGVEEVLARVHRFLAQRRSGGSIPGAALISRG